MKKLLTAVLSLTLLGAAALPVWAADAESPMVISPAPISEGASDTEQNAAGLSILINGQKVEARACVTVPLRAVAEKLGFTVAWDNGLITVTGSERYVELTVGEDRYFAAPTQEGLAGASLFSLGCAPYTVDGVTYVPLELFDALLGCREGVVTVENGAVRINTAPEA